jgi:subtilisin family serine protease
MSMSALDLVQLTALMNRTSGRSAIAVGLIDGPVELDHPELNRKNIHEIPGKLSAACYRADSAACSHGTSVAGVLFARRGSGAPAICPDCTLLVRPIFLETSPEQMPSASPGELAEAIIDCVKAGARALNVSGALSPVSRGEYELREALNFAASRGVITVVAAGNQAIVGGSAITRHPWVIPVAACDLQGKPLGQSNFGNSIGKQGLMAPGEHITSLGSDGKLHPIGGTSAAAPFVTGAIALVWSEFLSANATQIKSAVTQVGPGRPRTIIPPLLKAWAAYQRASISNSGGIAREQGKAGSENRA